VLYTSSRASSSDVVSVGFAATSKPLVLSGAPTAINSAPNFSPDSRWVTFQSNRSGHYEIYATTVDGKTPVQQLTSSSAGDNMYPAWGALNQIAYEHHEGNTSQINIIEPKTRKITMVADSSVHAVWSPNGNTLAYESQANGHWDIVLYNVSSKVKTSLTQNAGDNQGIAWAPNGTQIAFRSTRDGMPDLYVASIASKAAPLRLTTDNAVERNIAWAPDGIRIAYASDASGQSQIYVVNVNNRKPAQITKTASVNTSPTWRCDSSEIIYAAQDAGAAAHLYRVAPTGGGTPTALTSGAQADSAPVIGSTGGSASRTDEAR